MERGVLHIWVARVRRVRKGKQPIRQSRLLRNQNAYGVSLSKANVDSAVTTLLCLAQRQNKIVLDGIQRDLDSAGMYGEHRQLKGDARQRLCNVRGVDFEERCT